MAFNDHVKRVWHSRFARNVAIVATGTAGAQALAMAFAPLITRIYGPEAFGLLGTFMAIVAVVGPVAAFSYPIAIVLPREDQEAMGIARLAAVLSLGVASLVALVLWFAGDWIVDVLDIESISAFLMLVPLFMLLSAWVDITQQWLIRKARFAATARIAVANALAINTAKVAVGWFHPVAAALILIGVAGQALHAALLALGARGSLADGGQGGQVGTSSPIPLGTLAKRYYDFPLYRAPQIFINAASQSLPVLMLAAFFGPASAGFYALGRMVMGMPAILVGKSVSDVFYPRITEAARSGQNMAPLILKATGALAVIGLVPFGLIVIAGPKLFAWVFGAEWVVAGEYARWLALFFFFNFVNRPAVAAVPSLGLQKGLLTYEVFSTGSKVVALYVGFHFYDSDVVAIALFSGVGALAYVAMMGWIILESHRARS